ncbi:F-box protein CPR1-like [Amaranthus tricolor]|uniref:F-box protein CPR1-like n=1 Tax=Amaranthus tricolor TaxID=29722 RepID=UPI002585602E|nr:F-box protein CPR1-like [Amaranthus tricolor]
MEILPTDIITLIISKLPVKSLCRFKCVSKSWNSLICDPHFLILNLVHSLSSNKRLLIINYGTHLDSMSFDMGTNFEAKFLKRFDFPTHFSSGYDVSIVGSCNGLIALSFKNLDNPLLIDVVLWNPCSNTHFVLPSESLSSDDLGTDYTGFSFGFGYDYVSDDYKIVRIVDYFVNHDADRGDGGSDGGGDGVNDNVSGGGGGDDDRDSDGDDDNVGGGDDDNGSDSGGSDTGSPNRFGYIIKEIKAYSLKDHCWKLVNVEVSGATIVWCDPGAVINNHIVHWMFWENLQYKPQIRGFDLLSMDWSNSLPLPDLIKKDELGYDSEGELLLNHNGFDPRDFVVLGVLDECLCLVTRICSKFDNVFVWVMKEYGVQESWTRLFNVVDAGIVGSLLSAPLGCSNGGNEFLLRKEDDDGVLYHYNLSGKMMKVVSEISRDLKISDVNVCVECLVSTTKMMGVVVDESQETNE